MATPPPFSAPSFYPTPSTELLKQQFVGQKLQDVQGPAAILDAAVVRRNCQLMLEAVGRIGVEFRAHVKTHKTLEITKLMVGPAPKPVKLVCSTVSEIENLLPWLRECKAEKRHVEVLYGLPLSPAHIPRLGSIAGQLGEGSLGVFVDHPAHIAELDRVSNDAWSGRIPVWVNIDVGYHREGVTATSKELSDIAQALSSSPKTYLGGLYSHLGSSYGSSSPEDALNYMSEELQGLITGAEAFIKASSSTKSPNGSHHQHQQAPKITLSLGASPTATSIQNLLSPTPSLQNEKYTSLITRALASFALEFHAGVYTVNDLQQLATHARPLHSPSNPSLSLLSHADIAFRILAEVASVYPDRTEKIEALISAGSLALGREPAKSYGGWGVVTDWGGKGAGIYDPDRERRGWVVGRISQEHGILVWEGSREGVRELRIGEKVMVWPNHACIAAAHFGWFLVVDSELGEADTVCDVWTRWRGW